MALSRASNNQRERGRLDKIFTALVAIERLMIMSKNNCLC